MSATFPLRGKRALAMVALPAGLVVPKPAHCINLSLVSISLGLKSVRYLPLVQELELGVVFHAQRRNLLIVKGLLEDIALATINRRPVSSSHVYSADFDVSPPT